MTEKTESPTPKCKRGLAVHPLRRQRPVRGPAHLRVEVGLVPLVERARCARAERDAQDRGEAEHRRQLHRRREQSAEAGEHHQAHHARLGQRDEVAPIGGQGRLRDCGGHDSRAGYRGDKRGLEALAALASFGAMLIQFAFALSLLLAAPAAAQTAPAAPAPAEDLVKVALDTSAGRIVLALDRGHAPITTANFLRYVDAGRFNGESFYRAMKFGESGGLVQGGHHQRRPQALPRDRARAGVEDRHQACRRAPSPWRPSRRAPPRPISSS